MLLARGRSHHARALLEVNMNSRDVFFDDHATEMMGKAFDMACLFLSQVSWREELAKEIIKAAKTGERDPRQICHVALRALAAVSTLSTSNMAAACIFVNFGAAQGQKPREITTGHSSGVSPNALRIAREPQSADRRAQTYCG
jgi:hypothetical protein